MDESMENPPPTPSPAEQERTGRGSSEQRSGDFSHDPTFDPGELFDVIERNESIERVLAAMREFKRRGEEQLFARGVAVFARSARARGESVETVLAALEKIADALETDAQPGYAERETPLRQLVLRGVLLAFYGPEVVSREDHARRDRVERRRRKRDGPSSTEDSPPDAL